jgi:antitoxin component HigA of HigAB toxin-antitoxin module
MSIVTKTMAKTDPYLDLVMNVYPLKPITSDQEHQRAMKALRSLAGDKREVVAQFKIVLISIIEAYEHDAKLELGTSQVSAADVVRHLLEERNMSVNAFAKDRGIPQSALSQMLSGKRDWSKSAIVTISDFFALSPAIFLRGRKVAASRRSNSRRPPSRKRQVFGKATKER